MNGKISIENSTEINKIKKRKFGYYIEKNKKKR
jgi:hypothetical protein